jgi:hypothetical protein
MGTLSYSPLIIPPNGPRTRRRDRIEDFLVIELLVFQAYSILGGASHRLAGICLSEWARVGDARSQNRRPVIVSCLEAGF